MLSALGRATARLPTRRAAGPVAWLRTSTPLSTPPPEAAAVDSGPTDAEVMAALLDKRLPHHQLEAHLGDATRAARLRRTYMEASSAAAGKGIAFDGLPLDTIVPETFYESVVGTNCENVVGFVPLPVGVVGPLLLDGREVTIPLATTEGALVASTNRGARAITASGGAHSVLMADAMTRAPLLACADLRQAAAVKAYCESEEGAAQLRTTFSHTTRFGKLLDVRVAVRPRNRRLQPPCDRRVTVVQPPAQPPAQPPPTAGQPSPNPPPPMTALHVIAICPGRRSDGVPPLPLLHGGRDGDEHGGQGREHRHGRHRPALRGQ